MPGELDEALAHVHWCDECDEYECSICYDATDAEDLEVARHIVSEHERPWSDA